MRPIAVGPAGHWRTLQRRSVGKQRRIWAPTAFVFLWQATPNPGTAMFYFTTNELGRKREAGKKISHTLCL